MNESSWLIDRTVRTLSTASDAIEPDSSYDLRAFWLKPIMTFMCIAPPAAISGSVASTTSASFHWAVNAMTMPATTVASSCTSMPRRDPVMPSTRATSFASFVASTPVERRVSSNHPISWRTNALNSSMRRRRVSFSPE